MKIILFLLLTFAFPGATLAASSPNIILIISDDHGFPDYGFMGNHVVRTPNLDRIASQSLLYTRGYVMPVCSPSLACLLTGKLPHQHGITGNDLAKADAPPATSNKSRDPLARQLLGNSLVLPGALSKAGYLTFQTGKLWNVTATDIGFTSGMTNTAGRHGDAGLTIGRKGIKPILDFIDQASSQEKPFFVWYAPMMPHLPHNPPGELLAKYQGRGLGSAAEKYYAMVEWFDQTCGELDEHLDKSKLADNTVILYLADNGWDGSNGQDGRRAKLSPFELGIRTPMLVRWPGKVPPLRDTETLASIIDIAPTILKIAGAKAPADLPGLDLLDRGAMMARKSIFVEAYTHDIIDLAQPSRSLVTRVVIDGWSKLLLPTAVKLDKAYPSSPAAIELFDLKTDPLETKNLAAKNPDEVTRLQIIQDRFWKLP